MELFQQETGQPHSPRLHRCLGFQQKNGDDRFIYRVVSSSSFGSHWIRQERTPGQNRELAEEITSKVQRGKATEDTVRGAIHHAQTARKQRREDRLWAGRRGRQAEEGFSANWKPAQKRHKDYSLGKRAKEPLLPKFSILDEEVREA